MRPTEAIAEEFNRIQVDITANNPQMERIQVIEETLAELIDAGLITIAASRRMKRRG